MESIIQSLFGPSEPDAPEEVRELARAANETLCEQHNKEAAELLKIPGYVGALLERDKHGTILLGEAWEAANYQQAGVRLSTSNADKEAAAYVISCSVRIGRKLIHGESWVVGGNHLKVALEKYEELKAMLPPKKVQEDEDEEE